MKLRIGTRKSPLALAQAKLFAALLPVESELVPMTTSGDEAKDQSLIELGGKGLFTKELEEALLEVRIDIAVHSAKDMQTTLPKGLILACVPEREDPRDVLIGALPQGAVLGTSSLRRAAQMLHSRPDLKVVPLRGNVQTRIQKIERGEAHATLLALAGLKRLGMDIGTPLPLDEIVPAAGQGALGIECRENDAKTRTLLEPLNHAPTFAAVTAERALLHALDGSCRTPIAALGEGGHELRLRAMLLAPDGSQCWRVDMQGTAADAEALGREAGARLLEMRR